MPFTEYKAPEVATSLNYGKVFTRFNAGDATVYERAKALIELDSIFSHEYHGRTITCVAGDPIADIKIDDSGMPIDDSDFVAQNRTRSRVEYSYIDDGGKQVRSSLGYLSSKELKSLAEALLQYNANAEAYTRDVRLVQMVNATKPVIANRDLTFGRSEKAVAKTVAAMKAA